MKYSKDEATQLVHALRYLGKRDQSVGKTYCTIKDLAKVISKSEGYVGRLCKEIEGKYFNPLKKKYSNPRRRKQDDPSDYKSKHLFTPE